MDPETSELIKNAGAWVGGVSAFWVLYWWLDLLKRFFRTEKKANEAVSAIEVKAMIEENRLQERALFNAKIDAISIGIKSIASDQIQIRKDLRLMVNQ